MCVCEPTDPCSVLSMRARAPWPKSDCRLCKSGEVRFSGSYSCATIYGATGFHESSSSSSSLLSFARFLELARTVIHPHIHINISTRTHIGYDAVYTVAYIYSYRICIIQKVRSVIGSWIGCTVSPLQAQQYNATSLCTDVVSYYRTCNRIT